MKGCKNATESLLEADRGKGGWEKKIAKMVHDEPGSGKEGW